MTEVQKAVRATIKLGEIELDVFQFPDSTYQYSYEFLSLVSGKDKSLLSNNKSPYHLKRLIQGTPHYRKVKIEGINLAYQSISEDDLGKALGTLANMGHPLATSLLVACFQESLERRADAAFGVQRTEEERNDRLEARVKGKLARRTLTDSIRDYMEKHEELSDNYRKFVWSNCSDHLNKIILGCKAKKAKEFYQLPADSLLRNVIPVTALRELELAENLAGRFIDERDTEPLEAVKEACAVAFVKFVGLD